MLINKSSFLLLAIIHLAIQAASASEVHGNENLMSKLIVAQLQCQPKSVSDISQADTAKCLLSVGNIMVLNERCKVQGFSDGRLVIIDSGTHVAKVSFDVKKQKYFLSWNKGSGRGDGLFSLGTVEVTSRIGANCWRNSKVEMCVSDYVACD